MMYFSPSAYLIDLNYQLPYVSKGQLAEVSTLDRNKPLLQPAINFVRDTLMAGKLLLVAVKLRPPKTPRIHIPESVLEAVLRDFVVTV